ncbi:MAG TPA: hypothetical protein VEA38_12490, partial [Terriglobales bacterium]|nr:hypothetical protein [Terriglobales bacterium]
RRDYVRTRLLPTRQTTPAEVEAMFAALEREARDDLAAAGISGDAVTLARSLGMRFVGQSWELVVRWPAEATTMRAFDDAFRQAHERRYGHAGDRDVEIVTFRVAGIGAIPKPAPPRRPVGGGVDAARLGERPVTFGAEAPATAVYQRERLPAGAVVTGPAIVDEMGSTTVIPPGWTGAVGAAGELVLERRSL